MEKIKKIVLFILILLMGLRCSISNKSKIENEINDLESIKNKQTEKISQIVDREKYFIKEISVLKSELKKIVDIENIKNFNTLKNTSVIYKLKLIQEKLAYIAKLNEIKINTNEALNATDYSVRNYKDRLAVYNILSEQEIEEILERIKKVKKDYLPNTKKLELNIKDEEKIPLELIWKDIVLSEQKADRVQMEKEKVERDKLNSEKLEKEKVERERLRKERLEDVIISEIGVFDDNNVSNSNKPSIRDVNCIGDCENGYGTYTYNDGSNYKGYWKKGKRDGHGVQYIYRNGELVEKYVGSFKFGKKKGYGVVENFEFKTRLEGEFSDDNFLKGKYYYNRPGGNVDFISGDFIDLKLEGLGTIGYKNGDIYKGAFVNNVRHGVGVYTFNNGNSINLNYVNGKKLSVVSSNKSRVVNAKGDLCFNNKYSNRSSWGNVRINIYKDSRIVKNLAVTNGSKGCVYNLDYGIYSYTIQNTLIGKRQGEIRIESSSVSIPIQNY